MTEGNRSFVEDNYVEGEELVEDLMEEFGADPIIGGHEKSFEDPKGGAIAENLAAKINGYENSLTDYLWTPWKFPPGKRDNLILKIDSDENLPDYRLNAEIEEVESFLEDEYGMYNPYK